MSSFRIPQTFSLCQFDSPPIKCRIGLTNTSKLAKLETGSDRRRGVGSRGATREQPGAVSNPGLPIRDRPRRLDAHGHDGYRRYGHDGSERPPRNIAVGFFRVGQRSTVDQQLGHLRFGGWHRSGTGRFP